MSSPAGSGPAALGRRPVTPSPMRGRPDRRPRTRVPAAAPADRWRPLLDATRNGPLHYAPPCGAESMMTRQDIRDRRGRPCGYGHRSPTLGTRTSWSWSRCCAGSSGRGCGTPTRSTTWSRRRSEEHTSELQSHSDLVCRLLLEKKHNDGGYYTVKDCVTIDVLPR